MSVPYTFGTNTYAQSGQLDANFAALNSGLSNIDASQITTGTLPIAHGGTGASTAPAALTALGAAPATGGSYVAKAGDTMTGPLSGTTASFSGTITANGTVQSSTGTSVQAIMSMLVQTVREWKCLTENSNGVFHIQDATSIQNRLEIDTSGNCKASTAWGILSDAAIKTDIADNPRGLAEILKVRPRKYRYSDAREGKGHGFVAQELAEVMPELVGKMVVNDAGDELQTVTETGLIGPLINAVKELTARIEALEKRER